MVTRSTLTLRFLASSEVRSFTGGRVSCICSADVEKCSHPTSPLQSRRKFSRFSFVNTHRCNIYKLSSTLPSSEYFSCMAQTKNGRFVTVNANDPLHYHPSPSFQQHTVGELQSAIIFDPIWRSLDRRLPSGCRVCPCSPSTATGSVSGCKEGPTRRWQEVSELCSTGPLVLIFRELKLHWIKFQARARKKRICVL